MPKKYQSASWYKAIGLANDLIHQGCTYAEYLGALNMFKGQYKIVSERKYKELQLAHLLTK